MNHWEVLGIEATNDKRLIKLAYTELLKKNSPTEFPEEFKRLRKAYELANKEIKQSKEKTVITFEENDGSDIDSLILDEQKISEDKVFFDENDFDKEAFVPEDEVVHEPIELSLINSISELNLALNELYRDVINRNNVDSWKLLFSSPIFWNADKNKEVSLSLLEFLVEKHFLSGLVFKFIDESLKITNEMTISKDGRLRDMALGLSAYIKSIPMRACEYNVTNENISFEKLNNHLMLREYIENKCIYDSLEKTEIVKIIEMIQPEFHDDFKLYSYVVGWLWSLDAYEEIYYLLGVLNIPDEEEMLMEYQAHTAFRLKRYSAALSMYMRIDELDRNLFNVKHIFKYIGSCYFQLKDYEKAYFYLNASPRVPFADIDTRAFLTSARRLYIKELKNDEKANAIMIATLQYENGRYQDALITTQNYNEVFERERNYLQALCLAKLGRLEEAFVLFQYFMVVYQENHLCTWPLIVDLVIYCSDFITFDYLFDTILEETSVEGFNSVHKERYYPGTAEKMGYTEREVELFKIQPESERRLGYGDYWEPIYTQKYAMALIFKLRATLAIYEDSTVAPEMRSSAMACLEDAMPKVIHKPIWGFKFLDISYMESNPQDCIRLCDLVIDSYPRSPTAYYYKGRIFLDLEEYGNALSLLDISANKFGDSEYGVYSLEFAIECCEHLLKNDDSYHDKHRELKERLKVMKENVSD